MAERLKAHDWNSCGGVILSGVRIPLSPLNRVSDLGTRFFSGIWGVSSKRVPNMAIYLPPTEFPNALRNIFMHRSKEKPHMSSICGCDTIGMIPITESHSGDYVPFVEKLDAADPTAQSSIIFIRRPSSLIRASVGDFCRFGSRAGSG